MAEGAARFVDLVRLQGAAVEAERPRRAGRDAAPAGDAVGQLQRLAVGRVDLDAEAAAAEVVAGRPGHVGAHAHAAPAGDALVHVEFDERVPRVGLLAAHETGRQGLGRADHELVVGDVVLDAQPLQIAVAAGVADALQAAGRLGASGRGCEPPLDLRERVETLGRRQLALSGAQRRVGGDAHLQPDGGVLGQALPELAELGGVAHLLEVGESGVERQLAFELFEVAAREPGAHRQRRPLAGGDAVDGRLGARHGVAAGEDALLRGAPREGVRLERAPGRQRELALDRLGVGRVALGPEHGARRHVARGGFGALRALGVELDDLDRGRLAAAVELDAPRLDAELEAHTLVARGADGGRAGLDAAFLVPAEDRHLSGAETARGAGGVERGGAVADDADRAAEARFLAGAHLGEEAEGVAGELAAGDRDGLALPGADADEDGVVAAGEQAGERDVVTEANVADEAHAGLPQGGQLVLDDRGRAGGTRGRRNAACRPVRPCRRRRSRRGRP